MTTMTAAAAVDTRLLELARTIQRESSSPIPGMGDPRMTELTDAGLWLTVDGYGEPVLVDFVTAVIRAYLLPPRQRPRLQPLTWLRSTASGFHTFDLLRPSHLTHPVPGSPRFPYGSRRLPDDRHARDLAFHGVARWPRLRTADLIGSHGAGLEVFYVGRAREKPPANYLDKCRSGYHESPCRGGMWCPHFPHHPATIYADRGPYDR